MRKSAHGPAGEEIRTGQTDSLSWADAAAQVSADARAIEQRRVDLAEREALPYSNDAPEKSNEPAGASTDPPSSSTDAESEQRDRDEGASICKPCREGWHVNCTWDEAVPPERCTCSCPGAPPPVPGIEGPDHA